VLYFVVLHHWHTIAKLCEGVDHLPVESIGASNRLKPQNIIVWILAPPILQILNANDDETITARSIGYRRHILCKFRLVCLAREVLNELKINLRRLPT
jgi:hypothetical protein